MAEHNIEFKITDKKKKELFISVFQLLKNTSSTINLVLDKDMFHIQGMDKSHICLFDLKLYSQWFNYYEVNKKHELCFDSNIFHSIISTKGDDQCLVCYLENNDPDVLNIELKTIENVSQKKSDYDKYFKLSLIDYDYEQMNIQSTDYDADFSIPSKKISDMLSQLSNFGDNLNIHCSQDCIDFKTNGDSGEMRVNIPIDDLSSYSIIEDEEINLTYSLIYINKMCITNKLSTDIDFNLSNEFPMKISYNLGDNSILMFYIAPKMNTD